MSSPVRPHLSPEDLAVLLVRAYERGEKCPPATVEVLKAAVARSSGSAPSVEQRNPRISRRMLLAGFRREG